MIKLVSPLAVEYNEFQSSKTISLILLQLMFKFNRFSIYMNRFVTSSIPVNIEFLNIWNYNENIFRNTCDDDSINFTLFILLWKLFSFKNQKMFEIYGKCTGCVR